MKAGEAGQRGGAGAGAGDVGEDGGEALLAGPPAAVNVHWRRFEQLHKSLQHSSLPQILSEDDIIEEALCR